MPQSERAEDRGSQRTDGGVLYRQQYRRCGKSACSRCRPGQPGHGPYWYALWSEDGRRRTRYLGKELPPGVVLSARVDTDSDLRVQTLGTFDVRRGEMLVSWTSRRAAALFKCLLSAPGHRLSRDQVIELLWPEADPGLASSNLRTTIHLLRRSLDVPGFDTHLRADGDMLFLAPSGSGDVADDWLDAEIFERLATDAMAGRETAACRSALEHYTGEYLPDDSYEVWTEPRRGRLQQLRLDLLLHLAHLTATEGRLEEAEACLRSLLEADAGHEVAAAELMSLLAASGRGSEALRVYQALASMLEDDLGVGPSADVEALRARIVSQRSVDMAARPSVPSVARRKTNLPVSLTSFVGRDWELAEITDILEGSRLVTLTGPGGCGKTRLALEVATSAVDRYADGVWLIELAGLAEAALVPATVAAALGIEEQPDVPLTDTICDAWCESDMLLILDNCEHLVAACADLVAALLSRSPSLRVLATSREALGVGGEIAHYVPSLAVPDPERPVALETLAGYEAVALFVARAQTHRPDFRLTPANAPAVTQICARLDGLPLAIELAAARLSVLSVDGVAQRLDDRFRLLTGGPRTALPRQQTLRAAMDWSYSLLAPVEQALLRRLAVFSGGFSLEAAESVCTGGDLAAGEVLDRLGGLIEKSLLTLHDRDAASRYGMLETIRQYARERLAESGQESELLERHAFYFAAFAEEAGQGLVGADQSAWMSRVQADLDNIRAAMLWARQSDAVEVGFRLVSPIWRFWMLSGQSAEGRRWLNALMAVDRGVNVPSSIRAGAFLAAGALAYSQGDHASAKQLYAECLLLRRELGDLAGVAEALNGLGVAQQQLGEYRQAEQRFEESVRLRSEIGDVFGCHAPLSNLGILARYCGEYSRAAEMYERALAIQRQFGHTQAVVNSLNNLAQLWGDRGEYERARIMSQEALTMARDGGLVRQVVIALNTQAAQAIEQGELDTAEAHLNECLELARSTGDKTEENTTITNLAEVALGRGDPDRATQLAERALTALQQIGHRRGQAFALLALSEAARIRGEYDRAADLLDECVELRQGLGDTLGTIFTLESRARLAVNRGANEEAVRLFGSAARLRRVLETPLPPLWQAEYAQSIAHLREMLDRDAYATLWGEGESHAATFLSTGNATAQVYEIETSRGVRIETVAAEEA